MNRTQGHLHDSPLPHRQVVATDVAEVSPTLQLSKMLLLKWSTIKFKCSVLLRESVTPGMTPEQQHHLKPASFLFSNLFPLLLHLSLPHSTFTMQQFLPPNFSIPSPPLPFPFKLNPGRSSLPDPDRNNKVNRPKTPLPLPLPFAPPSSKTFLPSPLARSTSTVLTCDHRLYQVSFYMTSYHRFHCL